jgi:hypothetical protein
MESTCNTIRTNNPCGRLALPTADGDNADMSKPKKTRAKMTGTTTDRHKSRKMVRVPDELHTGLLGLAKETGVPVSLLVQRFIRYGLSNAEQFAPRPKYRP